MEINDTQSYAFLTNNELFHMTLLQELEKL